MYLLIPPHTHIFYLIKLQPNVTGLKTEKIITSVGITILKGLLTMCLEFSLLVQERVASH